MKEKIKVISGILATILIFLIMSWYVQSNIETIEQAIGPGVKGMLIYVLISMVSIVLAPVSSIPLIPIASNLWGWFAAGILNIISWTIGALIAFLIARVFGIKLIRKLVSLDKIDKIEKRISKDKLFISVITLRMVFPVDILSYALGLFSKMKLSLYTLATFIGIIPFAFIYAYFGSIPLESQVLFGGIISLIVLVLFISFVILRKIYSLRSK